MFRKSSINSDCVAAKQLTNEVHQGRNSYKAYEIQTTRYTASCSSSSSNILNNKRFSHVVRCVVCCCFKVFGKFAALPVFISQRPWVSVPSKGNCRRSNSNLLNYHTRLSQDAFQLPSTTSREVRERRKKKLENTVYGKPGMASNGFVYIFALKWVFVESYYRLFLLNLDTGKNVYTQQAVYAQYARQAISNINKVWGMSINAVPSHASSSPQDS